MLWVYDGCQLHLACFSQGCLHLAHCACPHTRAAFGITLCMPAASAVLYTLLQCSAVQYSVQYSTLYTPPKLFLLWLHNDPQVSLAFQLEPLLKSTVHCHTLLCRNRQNCMCGCNSCQICICGCISTGVSRLPARAARGFPDRMGSRCGGRTRVGDVRWWCHRAGCHVRCDLLLHSEGAEGGEEGGGCPGAGKREESMFLYCRVW